MRRFAAESHRARMIVLDLRPDLYFGAADRLMAKSAGLVAAWLGWESLALQEPVGLIIPGGAEVAPRRGRRHVLGMLDMIAAAYQAPVASTATAEALEAASLSLGRGDEICLITDLPVDPTILAGPARRLSRLRQMRFYLIEDRALTGAPPPGRYPSRGPDAYAEHQLWALTYRTTTSLVATALSPTRGGRLFQAMDILPRGVAAS